METFLIVDGNSLAYRAAFAHNQKWGDDLKTSTGKLTGATYRFFNMFDKVLHLEKPTHILVGWDTSRKTFRNDLYDEYKANREKKNEDFFEQFEDIKNILSEIGIKNVGVLGFEGDDIIGTYAKLSKADKTTILTGDKDNFQLVSDKITILYPKGSFSNLLQITPEYVKTKYNIPYDQFVDFKALIGDDGDNIPGIDGCGEKTAVKLLKHYGSAKNVALNKDNIKAKGINKKVKANILSWANSIDLILNLVTIRTDVPVPYEYEECNVEYNWENARYIFEKFEFNQFLEKLNKRGFYDGR